MKENYEKHERRLRQFAILLVISAVMCLFVTYVWLISTRTVNVSSFDVEIPTRAEQLFNSKNQYIGNSSANVKLLEVLEISKLGNYTIELKTDEKPFSLIIKFTIIRVPLEEFNDAMRNYSLILLALIDNADEIHWDINDAGSNNITVDEANEIYENIKDYGESIEKLNSLLAAVGY